MKRRLFALAVIVILLAVIAGSTLAYFTDSVQVHNVLTSGGVRIELKEYTDGGKPFVNGVTAMPGQKVTKVAKIHNHDAACFVRARVSITVEDPEGTLLDAEPVSVKLDPQGLWLKPGDGYYYYYKALPTGEDTAPLFEQVVFDGTQMGNEYQNATVYVQVEAEAVQSDNNGTDPIRAKGWPDP